MTITVFAQNAVFAPAIAPNLVDPKYMFIAQKVDFGAGGIISAIRGRCQTATGNITQHVL